MQIKNGQRIVFLPQNSPIMQAIKHNRQKHPAYLQLPPERMTALSPKSLLEKIVSHFSKKVRPQIFEKNWA